MLRYFPAVDVEIVHNKRDYAIIAFSFVVVTLCFLIDSVADSRLQLALGIAGWLCLIALLYGECKYVRAQIFVAVIFATIGENFASIYMAGYTYRLDNVPAFVPPGHGIVYLTAVVIGRCGFFMQYARKLALFVVLAGGFYSVLALTAIIGRGDQIGTLLFVIYLLFLFKGRSPMVYLGAFFITTWVEVVGTSLGTWNWAAIDPASTLTQGNPPSGVAAWYCLVDAIAMGCAIPVLNGVAKGLAFLGLRDSVKEEV
ncbi:MAG: hypothetical protein HFP77_09205 [Methylococcales symbiont of Iophon sp. n. MRB-2018]|nr:MAG: hypothetical protein HFP77_09205 [Methylococcales symbiont of Iophon sp. n. MRB-2018]KAF3978888.1 MAG: hypothetical protein HFP76_10420 [Methylococcales symbiont of Iophon sp. n. MRB-2018]